MSFPSCRDQEREYQLAGSWEILNSNRVLVAILHVDNTTIAWSYGFRNLIVPGPDPIALSGMPYDHARNLACMQALERGCDYIFFLDSDVVPPRDAILRLMAHKKPVISGVYARRSPPIALPVMQKNGHWVTQAPANALIEVDVVGAGCLLIHRTVLEAPFFPVRPGKQWFSWQVDMASLLPPGEGMSEDFTFCLHCRRNGIPIIVDTSVICRHIGYAEALPGSFGPLNCTPVT